MRVLPIGLAFMKGSGWLLVGIGLMVVVFASRLVNPWPKAGVGATIAAIGFFLILRTFSQQYRQCPSCQREILAAAAKCPYCATWSMDLPTRPPNAGRRIPRGR